jgi:hypothetical protein
MCRGGLVPVWLSYRGFARSGGFVVVSLSDSGLRHCRGRQKSHYSANREAERQIQSA